MHLRSGNGYPARAVKTPCGSGSVGNSRRRKSKSNPGMFSTTLSFCKWLLYLAYIWIRDLLYYVMLGALLSALVAIIASPFITETHPSGNYYDILGVTPFASRKDIKAAYRRLSLEHHPDKMDSNGPRETAYLRIREAYEALNVEDHIRCMYDLTRDIEGRWSVDDCIDARREYAIREGRRRQEELEKTRQKIEAEKKERQRRREGRLRQQEEERNGAKFTSRPKTAFRGWFADN